MSNLIRKLERRLRIARERSQPVALSHEEASDILYELEAAERLLARLGNLDLSGDVDQEPYRHLIGHRVKAWHAHATGGGWLAGQLQGVTEHYLLIGNMLLNHKDVCYVQRDTGE